MLNYATLSEVKDYLQIQNPVGSSHDITLQTLINSSSVQIEEFVGYTFEVEYGVDESRLNVRDLDIIVLKKYPIVGISSIESGVDFQRKDDIGVIALENRFTGDFSLSVSYGQNPPESVKVTCMELVGLFWNRRSLGGIESMSMGDFSIKQSTSNVQKQVNDILNTLSEYRNSSFFGTTTLYNQNI